MQDTARHIQHPVAGERSIRVRVSTERAVLANQLARLLGEQGHIELQPGTDTGADVLLLDCAAFSPEKAASLQRTARRHPHARVLWILDAAPAGRHAIRRVLEAVRDGWCDGFVVKDCSKDILLRGIAAVARREIFLPRSMLTRALVDPGGWRANSLRPLRAGRSRALLTSRERQVLHQVLRGLTSKEVGRNLAIKEDTVKKHLRKIYAKLGVRGRSQLLLQTAGRAWPTG
jgi:DNA-binding NarL/FixJ family response regulator